MQFGCIIIAPINKTIIKKQIDFPYNGLLLKNPIIELINVINEATSVNR